MSRAPPRFDTKSTSPSIVQTGDVLRCLSSEILAGVPPSALITQIDDGAMFPMSVPLRNPPLLRANAISFPSCDQDGANAPAPSALVRSFRSSPFRPVATSPIPPSRLQTKRSPAWDTLH